MSSCCIFSDDCMDGLFTSDEDSKEDEEYIEHICCTCCMGGRLRAWPTDEIITMVIQLLAGPQLRSSCRYLVLVSPN